MDLCLKEIFSFLAITFLICLAEGGKAQRDLLDKLFRNYNRLERPVANDNESLNVYLGLTVQQIVNIDEKMQNIVFSGWLDLNWSDYNLVWDPAEYNNISKIRLPVDKIWIPDVLLYNSADDSFDSTSKVNAVVEYTGSVSYIPPGIFSSTCNFKIQDFPFDRQVCALKFGSWTYDEVFINVTNKSDRGQNGSYIKNPEWILEGSTSYDCCPEKYPYVIFDILIRRRTLYYEFNIIFPCIFISCLTLLGFLLPPDSGEKVALEVTILLVIITFSQIISHSTPVSSLSVSRIGLYFTSIMSISSLSILANILVLIVHHRNVRINISMPKWVEIFICKYLATLLRMEMPARVKKHDYRMEYSKIDNLRKELNEKKESTTSSLFLAQNLNLKRLKDHSPRSSDSQNSTDGETQSLYENASDIFYYFKTDVAIIKNLLNGILCEICLITNKMKEKGDYENKQLRCKFAAVVIDRLCMVIFSILLILSTAIIFSADNFLNDSDPSPNY